MRKVTIYPYLLIIIFNTYGQLNFSTVINDCSFYFDGYFEASAVELELGNPYLSFGFILAEGHKTGEDAELSWFSPIIRISPLHLLHKNRKSSYGRKTKKSMLTLSLFGKFHNFVESRENMFNIGSQIAFRPFNFLSLSFKSGTLISTKKGTKYYAALSTGFGYYEIVTPGSKIHLKTNKLIISCDSIFFNYLKEQLEDRYNITILPIKELKNKREEVLYIGYYSSFKKSTYTLKYTNDYREYHDEYYDEASFGVSLTFKRKGTVYFKGILHDHIKLDIQYLGDFKLLDRSTELLEQKCRDLIQPSILKEIENVFELN